MATYTKTGFGRLDDWGLRFANTYVKTGFGRLDDFGLRGLGSNYTKTGVGVAGTFASGQKRPIVKRGYAVAGANAFGYRGGGVIFVRTGLQTNWWPEPPFMEDWLGVRAKGSGTYIVTRQVGVIKTGGATAGLNGYGAGVEQYTKTGAGKAGGVGAGRLPRSKIATGVVGAFGSGTKALTRAGGAKYGYATGGAKGFGYQAARVVSGRLRVRVGAYDESGIDSIKLLIDGVEVGEDRVGLYNRVTNPRFETSAGNWEQVGTATLTRSTSSPKYGTGCLSVAATGSGSGAQQMTGSRQTLLANNAYRLGAWVKSTAGAWVEARVVRGNATIGTKGIQGTGSWQLVQLDVYPSTTELHWPVFVSQSGAQTFFLDAISLVKHGEFIVDTADRINGLYDISAVVTDIGGHAVATGPFPVNIHNPATPEPRLVVEIAMDSNPGDATQVWTDVTADFEEGQWGHGRSQVLEEMEAGQAKIRLRNHDRLYDSINADSPYFQKFKVGKRIRCSAVYNDAIYRRFFGSISDIRPVWAAGGKAAYVDIDATDDVGRMARAPLSTNPATLLTNMVGTHNDVLLTSLFGGGGDITLTLVNPGTSTPDEIVKVTTTIMWAREPKVLDGTFPDEVLLYDGVDPTLQILSRDIEVTLAYSGGITTTAQQLVDALNDSEALALVWADLAPGNNGSGVVTALTKSPLSGGQRPSELVGERINWALDAASVPRDPYTTATPALRKIDEGTVTVQAVELDRVSVLDHVRLAERSELGEFFIDGEGVAVFHDQTRRTAAVLKHTYADAPVVANGEHLYIDAEPEQGTSVLYNDIEVSAPGMNAARAVDRASQLSHWPSALDHQTLLMTDAELEDRALLLLGRLKTPVDDLKRMLLDPMREAVAYGITTAWPHALALEVSDKLHVRREPPGGGELLYETFVESVTDTVTTGSRRKWLIEVGMSVAFLSGSALSGGGGGGIPPGSTWVLEDAVYGLLDTTTRLA